MERDLNAILATIAELWPTDTYRPGLTISPLEDGQIYASIVRWIWKQDEGLTKLVFVSTKRASTASAVADIRVRLGGKLAQERASANKATTVNPSVRA